jgi:hypothetical protein
METGFLVWETLAGHAPMEIYPYACFFHLNGGRAPVSKQHAAGRLKRLELLDAHLSLPMGVEVWSQITSR